RANWFTSSERLLFSLRFGLSSCRSAGFSTCFTCFFAFDGLHHDRSAFRGFRRPSDEVTQDSVVVGERMLQLVQGGLTAFDVQAHVVSLDQFLDWVSQLTAAPVFQTMNSTAFGSNNRRIALDHGGHLLALIGMHNEHYFVVTHGTTPCGYRLLPAVKPVRHQARQPAHSIRVEQETIDTSTKKGWLTSQKP